MGRADQIRTAIHRTNRNEIILELAFDGGRWRVDSEIREDIAEAIKASSPAAVLLDLSSFRYRGGDYISGFLEAFIVREHGRFRPACFVSPPDGVKSLFDAIDPSGALGFRYFPDRAEALDYLRACLETTGQVGGDVTLGSEQELWMCTNCWALRHRDEVEASHATGTINRDPSSWKCRRCRVVGRFVSQEDKKFGLRAIDLTLEAWLGELKNAGYPVYSGACAVGKHEYCDGKAGIDSEFKCECECHTAQAREA